MNFFPPPDDPKNNNEFLVKQKGDFSDIPIERRKAAQKQAKKLFFILLVTGFIIGGIFAFGLLKLIQKFGLNDKPNHPWRIEQYKN